MLFRSESRIRAAAPLAPGVLRDSLVLAQQIASPTLLIAGDLDRLVQIDQERRLSAALSAGGGPHWFVTLHGAGHLSFADVCLPIFGGCGPDDLAPSDAQAQIRGWTTAFFLRYVAGDDRYAAWFLDAPPAFVDIARPSS